MAGYFWKKLRNGYETTNAQTQRIKKQCLSKFEEFLRFSSAGHLAVGVIGRDCMYCLDMADIQSYFRI